MPCIVLSVATALVAGAAVARDYPDLVSTVIRGSSVYPPGELFDLYRDHLGQPISSDVVQAIAAAIADRYASDGYSRPAVTVDDRLVDAGVLAFVVVETRISTVAVTGDPGPYAGELASLGQSLQNELLLRNADLQSTIRRMREHAGLSLSASTVRVADTPGAYRLNLATEFKPVSGRLRVTNRGTDEIGPNFMLGQVSFNGLADGRGDLGLLFSSAMTSDEYHGVGLSGGIRPDRRKLRIAVLGFRSRSEPTERVVDRDILYLRDRLSVAVSRPLLDTPERRLTLTAGLRAEDLAIRLDGVGLRNERLRLVELGARLVGTGRRTRQYAAGIELVQGINGAGSGLSAPDIPADPRRADLSLLLLDFVRVAELGADWRWRLNALGQYSRDVLTYSERFKIGGERLGRGFEVTEIAGDRGLGARVELLRALAALHSKAGRVSAYLTYDLAVAWKNDAPGRESAATAGVGLALEGETTSGRIELARPLTHADVEGRDDTGLFLEFSLRW